MLRSLPFLVLLLIIFVLGSLNVPFFAADDPPEVFMLYVLSTLVFLAFVIYGLVLIRYLARLYAERKRRVLGSNFKTKMVVGALALSLLPVLALFYLSYGLLNRTMDKWFPRPLEIVRDDAVYIVHHLLREQEDRARANAEILASNPDLKKGLLGNERELLDQAVNRLGRLNQLHWAAVVDRTDKPVALYRRGRAPTELLEEVPRLLEPRDALAYTTTERIANDQYSFARVRVESATGEVLGTVIVARPLSSLSADLLHKMSEIESQSQAYDEITRIRKAHRWQAPLILLLITTLLLLAATWAALYLAKQVTVPIQALAIGTEEISKGNFAHQVDVHAQDELRTLVDSFNLMTTQLGENRRRLEQAVTELEQRRQWMETILESIPTGVLTLDAELRLLRANAAAEELLGRPMAPGMYLLGRLSPETATACAGLFPVAAQSGRASAQIDFRQPDRISHVAVTVSALRRENRNEGYVMVLDDLSEVLKAQKAAAWREVAQRVAHEIKNPLTPIQLSADRILRYLDPSKKGNGKQRHRQAELIAQCARMIGQEVYSLKLLVDEFSRFARFPQVRPVPTQLNDVIEAAASPYREKGNGIRLQTRLAPRLPKIVADPELLRHVVTNLIRNATEALAQNHQEQKEILIRTRHLKEAGTVELMVADTGPGISAESKERLFLPFFSTKREGMGLGLAIVSRIVSEHHGNIRVEDNQPCGARFILQLPIEAPPA